MTTHGPCGDDDNDDMMRAAASILMHGDKVCRTLSLALSFARGRLLAKDWINLAALYNYAAGRRTPIHTLLSRS